MKTLLPKSRPVPVEQPARKVQAQKTQNTAALNHRKPTRKPGRAEEPSTDFGKTLQSLLGKKQSDQKVSEEEIYAALILQQLKDKYGSQYTSDWKSTFKLNAFDKPSKEKFASAERAANDSMKFFVESTLLSEDEAKSIKDTAFNLAQLDNRTDKLWDHQGGDRENTIAVTSFSNAQKMIQERLNAGTSSASVKSSRKVAATKKLAVIG
jgi:hypothetical protein